tara:strand:+ start:639 stop:794 length:156 start_codon:yes stop_codon:yes gene_type:complete
MKYLGTLFVFSGMALVFIGAISITHFLGLVLGVLGLLTFSFGAIILREYRP